ncbi:MAG: copper amine oxidase N-terminal domain-containing protein [Armatimonadetes bacterium]|nr:copper amine oxidase N-terminal domain-containing protein [Armatimonadota bacterium]
MNGKNTLLIIAALVLLINNYLLPQAKIVIKERVTITVDKTVVRTDVPPISINSRTLVPVRSVFEAFSAEIGWFPRERRVFIRKDKQVIWLHIGDAHAKVDGQILTLDVPVVIYRGRAMVPLRFLAETLGAVVTWDSKTQTITIVTPEQTSSPTDKQPN